MGRGRVVRRMLGLLAAGAVAAAMAIGLAGDARPLSDGFVGRHDEDQAASTADTPGPGVQYDELAAAPHVMPAKLVVVRAHSIDSSKVAQPSSTPGSRCECTSMRPVTELPRFSAEPSCSRLPGSR